MVLAHHRTVSYALLATCKDIERRQTYSQRSNRVFRSESFPCKSKPLKSASEDSRPLSTSSQPLNDREDRMQLDRAESYHKPKERTLAT